MKQQLPKVLIKRLETKVDSASMERPFLSLKREVLVQAIDGGEPSKPYRFDHVQRTALDAVAVALIDRSSGEWRIGLRSCIRPPLLFRNDVHVPLVEEGNAANWEVPAGLIEKTEKGVEGILACAARETEEEMGIEIPSSEYRLLGHPSFLSPGLCGEAIHYCIGFVDGRSTGKPSLDGSPLEEGGVFLWLTLEEAQKAVDDGIIRDAKSEIVIRRATDARNADASKTNV